MTVQISSQPAAQAKRKPVLNFERNEVIDSLGRVIKLKEVNGKGRVAFYRALGNKDASNVPILAEYWPVMAVESIGGNPCLPIKALIDIEMTHSDLENGDALGLINEWLSRKEEEKATIAATEDKENLKK